MSVYHETAAEQVSDLAWELTVLDLPEPFLGKVTEDCKKAFSLASDLPEDKSALPIIEEALTLYRRAWNQIEAGSKGDPTRPVRQLKTKIEKAQAALVSYARS